MLEPSSSEEESDTDATDDGPSVGFAGPDILRGGRPLAASGLLAGRVGFAASAYGFGFSGTGSIGALSSGLSGSASAGQAVSSTLPTTVSGSSASVAGSGVVVSPNINLLQQRSHSLTMGFGNVGAGAVESGNTSSLESIGSSNAAVLTSSSIPASVSSCGATHSSRSNSIRPASPSPSLAPSDRGGGSGGCSGAGQVDDAERSEKEEEERRRRLQLYVFVMRCVAYPFNAKQPTDMARRQIKVTRSQLATIRERFQVKRIIKSINK